MGSTASMLWGFLFATVGMGYVIYGRKQRRGVAVLCGILLCLYPYFISNVYLTILIGLVLMAAPFYWKI